MNRRGLLIMVLAPELLPCRYTESSRNIPACFYSYLVTRKRDCPEGIPTGCLPPVAAFQPGLT